MEWPPRARFVRNRARARLQAVVCSLGVGPARAAAGTGPTPCARTAATAARLGSGLVGHFSPPGAVEVVQLARGLVENEQSLSLGSSGTGRKHRVPHVLRQPGQRNAGGKIRGVVRGCDEEMSPIR